MKKVGKIIVAVLLVVSLTWSAVSTFLLYRSKQDSGGFKPVVTQASDYAEVGQMRLPKLWETLKLNHTKDFVDLEFLGLERGTSRVTTSAGDAYDVLRIKVTLREQVEEQEYFVNFWIYRYCPEDGFWYAVYYPGHASKAVSHKVSGERIEEYDVPPDILAEPGLYAFGIDGLGCCSFEVE